MRFPSRRRPTPTREPHRGAVSTRDYSLCGAVPRDAPEAYWIGSCTRPAGHAPSRHVAPAQATAESPRLAEGYTWPADE